MPATGSSPIDAIKIILVGARGGANVGAVCRAIKNMGGGRLVTVACDFDVVEAHVMAVHAADVLAQRQQASTLREALAGCGVVVGTTARRGAYRRRARDLRALATELVERQTDADDGASRPLAWVFGPEDRGLSNQEIAACHHLATIDTAPEYPSLNLAQAVMVCLYELRMARLAAGDPRALRRTAASGGYAPADAAALEAMYQDLADALVQIGFLPAERPDHIMASLRALIGRAHPDERELRILRGLARQIRWFADDGREVAAAKKAAGRRLR